MNEKTFKERVDRLNEVSKVIEKLPSEIRALTFSLLADYITGEGLHSGQHPSGKKTFEHHGETGSKDEFFAAFTHDKPADNLKLIGAYLYREYGSEAFSLEEVRNLAEEVGLTIPDRINMTFRQAKDNGKKLFASAGRSKFKPTVHGETYFKTTYSVKKGTKKKPIEDEEK